MRGKWRPHMTPKLKKRTALLRKLKEVFRRRRSQRLKWVVEIINPILRGWVRYFVVPEKALVAPQFRKRGRFVEGAVDAGRMRGSHATYFRATEWAEGGTIAPPSHRISA